MGEGGAVYTNDVNLNKIIESFRDWGRDCWCQSGQDNTCKKRFSHQFGELPLGYDHKYVYSHLGYNLKATEMQAAIGCAQLKKLPEFGKTRRKNWQTLHNNLSVLEDVFILPQATEDSDPSWFGFLLTVREGLPIKRDQIVEYLESKGIQTRMLFAGNLIKHPCFDELRERKTGHRVIGELSATNTVMQRSFWLGVYPGLSEPMLEYITQTIKEFIQK
jgi:CDP-6-deoxy-D-xylo-4-hexulose-3-dehydrase